MAPAFAIRRTEEQDLFTGQRENLSNFPYVCNLGMFTQVNRMKYLWTIILSVIFLPLNAQRMGIEDFARYKKTFLKKATFTTNKQNALLDLFTNEKGFQFYVGDVVVSATEGEGFVTLSLPNHTAFLTIEHPDYGQIAWKIPGKGLKKKKHYHAYLHTESQTKEFRQEKQWVIFNIQPEHVIIHIDSTIYPVRDGHLLLYLPIGKHSYRIESPFYTALNDTIEVTDATRVQKKFILKPFYAYLTVETGRPDAQILLDGQPLGSGRIETGRLMPGRYRLTVKKDKQSYYDRLIEIANAERKVIDLRNTTQPSFYANGIQSGNVSDSANTVTKNDIQSTDKPISKTVFTVITDTLFPQSRSQVHITAFDKDTEIWLNREQVGKGEWQGELAPGFYAVSSQKDSLDSRTLFFWVEAGKAVELNLTSPLADYGMLNIACNEVNAEIYLNDVAVGFAPCVLRNLPIDRSYTVRLVKGKKIAEKTIHLRGNDMVYITMNLKKR